MFVVLSKGYGNSSNRLLQNSHFEAYCIERGLDLFVGEADKVRVHPAFGASRSKIFQGKIPWRFRPEILGGVIDFKDGTNCISRLDHHLARWGRAFVTGWGFRSGYLVEKHRVAIRKFQEVDASLLPLDFRRELGSLELYSATCAIHIRRKDYRYWRNGRYYFSNEQWASAIEFLCVTLQEKTGAMPKIIIFTDEPESVADLPWPKFHSGDWSLDQYMMGSCNYIVGPPSTYSMWASFNWGAKLLHLEHLALPFDLEAASVCMRLE